MPDFLQASVRQYLDQLASAAPTPGRQCGRADRRDERRTALHVRAFYRWP